MSLKYAVIRGQRIQSLRYYRHDRLHRRDGAAFLTNDSQLYWWHKNPLNSYYLYGNEYSREEYESKIRSYS